MELLYAVKRGDVEITEALLNIYKELGANLSLPSVYPLIWLVQNASMENNGYRLLDVLLEKDSPFLTTFALTGILESVKEKYSMLYIILGHVLRNASTATVLACIDTVYNYPGISDYIKTLACEICNIKIIKHLFYKGTLFTKNDVFMISDKKVARQVYNLLCQDLHRLRQYLDKLEN